MRQFLILTGGLSKMIVGGPYDPYTERIIPIFILYVFLFPVALILSNKLTRKGKLQDLKSARYLGWAFLTYSIGIIVTFIGLLEVFISGEFREIYRLSLPLGYSLAIIGNILLLLFGFTLFGFQKKVAFIFAVWTAITLVLINLDLNWYGVPHASYAGQFSLRSYSSLSMTFLAISIYCYLIAKIKSLQIGKPLVILGYKLIIWSLYSFILFWICMTLDAINIVMVGEGYSLFVTIAWIFALFFWLLSYMGLMMPPKLKSYFEKRIRFSSK